MGAMSCCPAAKNRMPFEPKLRTQLIMMPLGLVLLVLLAHVAPMALLVP